MDWIALKHALLSHLPVASGLLLPWALFAAQRPGRGMRPWWTVARYLGWAGGLGILAAFLSGYASGRFQGIIPPNRLLPLPASGLGADALLFRHSMLGVASLLAAGVAIWAMNRSRKDHESLGLLALVLGLAWCAILLVTGESGYRLAHGQVKGLAQVAPPVVAPAPRPEPDPEAKVPLRALDYASLEALHPEPVKSPAHGGRWIRAWGNPEAVAAYRAGGALPPGAFLVLSSVEDRWGRPGPEVGPLYALEMKATGPSFTFYWPRIPMANRAEFGGDSKAYWRGQDARLGACRACHAAGMAEPSQRSRWRARRLEAPTEGRS